MKIKTFTVILTLEFTASNIVILGKEAEDKLIEIESEVNSFISDKPNATFQWSQSTSSVFELLIDAKGVPFTQVTAIVYW